jgi:hypothetical protein
LGDWTKLFEALTKPLPVASSLFLLCFSSLVLFTGRRLGMALVLDHYQWAVGLAFLVAVCWLAVSGTLYLGRLAWKRRKRKQEEKRLHRLATDEKQLLATYVRTGVRSANFSISDAGVAQGLADEAFCTNRIRRFRGIMV